MHYYKWYKTAAFVIDSRYQKKDQSIWADVNEMIEVKITDQLLKSWCKRQITTIQNTAWKRFQISRRNGGIQIVLTAGVSIAAGAAGAAIAVGAGAGTRVIAAASARVIAAATASEAVSPATVALSSVATAVPTVVGGATAYFRGSGEVGKEGDTKFNAGFTDEEQTEASNLIIAQPLEETGSEKSRRFQFNYFIV